ncbi:MAG: hypothetical protein AB8B66_01295 [Rickettsiaceae bacterium]
MRKYKGQLGSLQLFVESELDLWVDKQREAAYSCMSDEIKATGAAFTSAFGQWNAHPGNQIMTVVDDKTQLVFIDNEGMSNKSFYPGSFRERPFVFAGGNMAKRESTKGAGVEVLEKPSFHEFSSCLERFHLPPRRVNMMYMNLTDRGKSNFEFLAKNGKLCLQFHKRNEKAFPHVVDSYPEYVRQAYNELDPKVLDSIFFEAKVACPEHFNPEYFSFILKRSKQQMEHINDTKKMRI